MIDHPTKSAAQVQKTPEVNASMEPHITNEARSDGMFPVFTGSFERALDEKMRLALPREFRQQLVEEPTVLYFTPGLDGALALYTPETFNELASKLAQQSPTQRTVRTFSRLFYSQAYRSELDRQGRLRVSQGLAALAGLEREVTLIGVRDHIEVWDTVRWRAFCERELEQYDSFAEQAFSGAWTASQQDFTGIAPSGGFEKPSEQETPATVRRPK